LTAHTYWRVELGKHITLWGGPEAGLGQYVINRTTVYADASSHSVSDKRSAFVAGVAVGLDARFWRALRVGVELGESVLLKPARANAEGDTLDLRAMTRFALVLRYL
jgi:hypothetical protein